MKTPNKHELDDAIFALEDAQRAERREIQQRAEMSKTPAFVEGYPLEHQAKHDAWATRRIENLERVCAWLRAHRVRIAQREFDVEAAARYQATVAAFEAGATSDELEELDEAGRCECGAMLAHVTGPAGSGDLCPECDREHLHELTD